MARAGPYAFQGVTAGDGQSPESLTRYHDALYGTTNAIAFSLAPPSPGSPDWREEVLYQFPPAWFGSTGNLAPEGNGGFYGTSPLGFGTYGAVYELTPPVTGSAWAATTLHIFADEDDGGTPEGVVLIDGVLYGTTTIGPGGPGCNCGTIYALRP